MDWLDDQKALWHAGFDQREMRKRISELEAIVRQQKSMLDEIAEAAGFDLTDTYSAASIISGLKDPRLGGRGSGLWR